MFRQRGDSRVEAQRGVALFEQPRPFQAAVPVFEALLAPVLGDHHRSGRKNSWRLSQHSQRGRILLGRIVRRIQIHHFVASWFCHFVGSRLWTGFAGSAQKRRHALRVHRESALNSKPLQIAPQHLERRCRPLHKSHLRRPSAQRLQAHRSRTRIQIQKRRAPTHSLDARGQHIEERFAQAVAGRPGVQPRRPFQPSRTERSRDDAHRPPA